MTEENPSRPVMAIRKRTRSNAARKKFFRRAVTIWSFAILFAMAATIGLYRYDSRLDSAPIYPGNPPPTPQVAFETATPDPSLITQVAVTPSQTPQSTITSTFGPTVGAPLMYTTQAGDTLQLIAGRFMVSPSEITSLKPVSSSSLLEPGQLLFIPNRLGETTPDSILFPDSETVYSPTALDLDVEAFVKQKNGYLNTYREYLNSTGWNSGAQVIERVALDNSINPRLLLSLLEYQSGWVRGQPVSLDAVDYPLGHKDPLTKGLFQQLSWAVSQLSLGYYGWRNGLVVDLTFTDGQNLRLSPKLNAGTVAVMYYFSQQLTDSEWQPALYGDDSLTALHTQLFGDPQNRADTIEPLYPSTLSQPTLILPFETDVVWSFTYGPHSAWGPAGARAALDFAPASASSGCTQSDAWVTAAATGLVVRSKNGVVVIDLDGDGKEQSYWVLVYLHIAEEDRIPEKSWVSVGDRLGHPSCVGGNATGTHFHITRKYNGEWILAGGSIPFEMSGWRAQAGSSPGEGILVKDDRVVVACTCSDFKTNIIRPETEVVP
jgi:LasA protease